MHTPDGPTRATTVLGSKCKVIPYFDLMFYEKGNTSNTSLSGLEG